MTASTAERPRVMVDMSATLIHHGHIRLLKKAAEIGDVVVVLTTDEEIKKKKGYTPELSFEERKEILESIRYVKEVVAGLDCGLNIVNYNDIQVGDIIEAYEETEIKKTL